MNGLHPHWGTDLALLRNLTHQNDRDRGRDLNTREREGLRDLKTLEDADNLKQALLLRFLTHRGEMAALGHAGYGSRLYELIGQLNTLTNRNRAKMFVLQALAQEPRVDKVLAVNVTTSPANRNQIDIEVLFEPIDSDTEQNLVFSFSLEGGSP